MSQKQPTSTDLPLQQMDPVLIEAVLKLTACSEVTTLANTLTDILKHLAETDSISIFQLVNDEAMEKAAEQSSYDAMKLRSLSGESDTDQLLANHPEIQQSVRKRQPVLIQNDPSSELYVYPMIARNEVSHILRVASDGFTELQIKQIEVLWKIWQHLFSLVERNELDGLTGLLNRVAFDNRLKQIFSIGQKDLRRGDDSEPKVLALIDIDHFKEVNDEFGHLYGDEVLVQLSRLMSRSFRGTDMVFRFGGEEFVIILSNCKIDNAKSILDRFREMVANHQYPQIGQKTVSIGLTQIESAQLPTTILDRADKALYFSKENGRNQCNIYEDLVAKGKVDSTPPTSDNVELF